RPSLRFPIVDADAAASWVVEGSNISETDPTLGEVVVTPFGLKALTTVSNELIADSAANAEAAGVVGDGLVRSFARALDSAFFSTSTSNGPGGLGGIDYQTINVDGAFVNFDPFLQAISQVEQYGSVITGFAASFSTVEQLSQLKRFEATATIVSNEPLLAQSPGDVSNPVNRRIFGVPLYSVPESTDSLPTIEDGVVWAIAADKSFTVLRQDLSVQANPYSAFSSDSTQVRGVMRAAFGFTQPNCVVQIVSGGS
ncbi:phage major capsid protein, partial [Mycobacterium sp.]|uniref:phage major capsid protein n=1 Tax=Mycobacterium sp. TaxID=1785 RepID=UPI003BB08AB2